MQSILIQLDTDEHPSSFDQVVAVDAGTDRIFSYGGICEDNVEGLVHGAMFTRGPADLHNTAIFVGGSQVEAGERVMQRIQKTWFGPMRVSVMMDSNGSNTTAAAAVVAAGRHATLKDSRAIVLGGTGPVGQRVARILASEGCPVRLVSRSVERATTVCDAIRQMSPEAQLEPVAASDANSCIDLADGCDLMFAAGAAGVTFLPEGSLAKIKSLQVAIDLNAVPPVGLGDVTVTDNGQEHAGVMCYGALGVGGTKMKVHKRAILQLFESNDCVFDTAEIYQLAQQVAAESEKANRHVGF